MKPACLLVFAAASFSCGDVSNTVDDLATIDLGAEALNSVKVDRSVALGVDRLPLCLDVSVTLPSSNATVALANSADGCMLTFREPNLQLADAKAIERAREASGPFDVDAVRAGSIEVQKLELSTTDGAPLLLSTYIDALSVQVDGEALLDRTKPAELQAVDPKLTRQLPASVIDKLKASLTNNQVATADVTLTLWLSAQTLVELPDTLSLSLVLQPHLQVNLVDAL